MDPSTELDRCSGIFRRNRLHLAENDDNTSVLTLKAEIVIECGLHKGFLGPGQSRHSRVISVTGCALKETSPDISQGPGATKSNL